MSNADNSGNNKEESYHNVPGAQYFYWSRGGLGRDIAIHKEFFKYSIPFTFLFGCISTAILLLTDWWQLAFTRIATFLFIDYYYIGFPGVGITVAYFYLKHNRKEKRKLKEQIEHMRLRKYQDSVIEQNSKR
jgi:hypothetical protein